MPGLSIAARNTSTETETPFGTETSFGGDVRSTRRLADLLLEVARSVNQDLAATIPSRLEGDPRLEALRSVVLEKDRAAFSALLQRVEDPDQFAEAISAVLASAVALAEARDQRLETVLAPAMHRAVRDAIHKDPDTVVGVVYPLVGPAIRKSIAETLDSTLRSINQGLKDSFSWRGLKWRLEAYRSGRSFADVVLKHTVVFRVEHLFLIHRQSGLLLEHMAASQADSQDPHMVSGMLTAIQDFAHDSFKQAEGERAAGIDSLRLGDLLIWCEDGPFALLAAVIRGNPPDTLRTSLRNALVSIHHDLGAPLQQFDGNSATLGELGSRLEACLQQQEQPQETKLSPWLWALPLTLLVILGSWIVGRVVEERRVDDYLRSLRNEPGIVVTDADRRDGKWHISGLRDPLATNPSELFAKTNLNPERVAEHWEPYQALNPVIVRKRMAASLKLPPGMLLSLVDGTIRADGSAPEHWVERARAFADSLPAGAPPVDLTRVKDVQDPSYIRLRDAIQAHVITFDSGAPRPPDEQEAMLDALAEELSELNSVARGLGFSVRVMIVGHADATGKETSNLSLSAARAEVVRSMLRARGIAPHLLLVRSAGTLEPEQVGPTGLDLPVNRRVTFTVNTAD